MDRKLIAQSSILRKMGSDDAADWLMDQYPIERPDYGNAIILLAHRSWKKRDQIRLADYYFQKIPFANSRPYEVFASFMSTSNLIKMLRKHLPNSTSDLDLLVYHLEPILRKKSRETSKNDIVDRFLEELNQLRKHGTAV